MLSGPINSNIIFHLRLKPHGPVPHKNILKLHRIWKFLDIDTIVWIPRAAAALWRQVDAKVKKIIWLQFLTLVLRKFTSWFWRILENQDFRRRLCRLRWSTSSPPPPSTHRLGGGLLCWSHQKWRICTPCRAINMMITMMMACTVYWPTWVIRCLNSEVSTVPLPSLSRARKARVTWWWLALALRILSFDIQ